MSSGLHVYQSQLCQNHLFPVHKVKFRIPHQFPDFILDEVGKFRHVLLVGPEVEEVENRAGWRLNRHPALLRPRCHTFTLTLSVKGDTNPNRNYAGSVGIVGRIILTISRPIIFLQKFRIVLPLPQWGHFGGRTLRIISPSGNVFLHFGQ